MEVSQVDLADGKVAITHRGDLFIQHAAGLKETLLNALYSGDHIVLNLSGCTGMDLSCMQLICSAHLTALGMNKIIEMGAPIPDVVASAAECAGYFRDRGCPLDVNNTCLWIRR